MFFLEVKDSFYSIQYKIWGCYFSNLYLSKLYKYVRINQSMENIILKTKGKRKEKQAEIQNYFVIIINMSLNFCI